MSFAVLGSRTLLATYAGPQLVVDPAGLGGTPSDSHTRAQAGSTSTPLATLQKAIQLANAGDRILCRPGTYPDTDTRLIPDAARKKSQVVRITPYPGDAVPNIGTVKLGACTNIIVDGLVPGGIKFHQLVTSYTVQGVKYDATDIIIRNFSTEFQMQLARSNRVLVEGGEFDGSVLTEAGTSTTAFLLGDSGGANVAEDITVRDIVIHGYNEGLRIGRFRNLTVEDVEWYDIERTNSSDHPDCLQFYWATSLPAEGFVGRRLWIHDCTAQGLFVTAPVNGARLENSLVEPMGETFTEADFFQGDDVEWVNNTIDGSVRYPVHAVGAGETSRVTNGRMVNNIVGSSSIASTRRVGGVTYSASAPSIGVEQGNIWKGGKPAAMGALGSQSIFATPTYVDKPAHDYRLDGASPGKGAGFLSLSGLVIPTLDRVGRTRGVAMDPGSDQG